MKRPPQEPTTFPYVDATVAATNPAAAKYAASALDRLKQRPTDMNGPPMPRLDAPFQAGTTMADQARAQRQPPPGSVESFQPEYTQQPAVPPPPAAMGILQGDALPQAATNDPAFRSGMGSMVAVNQPNMAMKYGVIRGGRHIPPAQLKAGEGKLGKSTVEGLEAALKFTEENSRKAAESAAEKVIQKESEAGLGGATARVASPTGSSDTRPTAMKAEDIARAVNSMDEFDYNQFREMMMRDLINNDNQRQLVEERLEPISLSDLLMQGYVTQTVPIRPGEYEPCFISFDAEEDLKLKEMLAREIKNVEGADRFYLDKYSLMAIVLGTVSINGRRYGTHRDEHGHFSEELYWTKYHKMVKLPYHIMASLGVHWSWFDQRVRKLVQVSNLKNG